MISSSNTRIENVSRRGRRTDVALSPQRLEQGATETDHNRPSSSGGRLEQHLGDVESVDKSSVTDIEPSSPTIPMGVGLLGASRVTNEFGCVGTGRRNVDRIATPSGKPCAFKGGNVAGSVSSNTRTVDHQPPLRRASDAVQLTTGRSDRERMGGGRRRSLAFVGGPFVGTNIENLSKKGFPRPKRRDARTSRRAASQVSFAPPAVEGIGDGVGESGKCIDSNKGRRENEDETGDCKFRMHAGQSNILVSVRLRPLLKHDRDHVEVVKVLGNKMVVLMDPAKLNQDVDPLRVNRTREKRYAFDYVFDGTATQRVVYENTTKFLIQGVLDGFNATVFAYGCTGAGKTYTMIGSDHERHQGIMVLTLQDLFDQQRRHVGLSFQDGIKPFYYDSTPSSIAVLYADGGDDAQASVAQGRRYSVTVSFLEVYNENIRDLLNDTGEFLDLREDPIKGPITSGLAEVEVRTPEEIMGILHQGNLNRTQQATRANAVSSRSHAILQVVVESRDKAPGTVAAVHVGKLSLVDLAGSERAAATQNRGVRLVEGANINRSLLALGNCINALGERGNKGQFVPYRDSKLTRLLKDSLGGNCRTVMIANISGAASSFEETLNTLKYANRAKNIKTNATRNSLDVNHHITEYVNLIGSLRSEITRLKHQLLRSGRGHCGAGNDRPEPAVVFTLSRKMRTNSLFPATDQDKPTHMDHMDDSNEEGVEARRRRNGVRQGRKGGREDTFLFGDDDRDAGATASTSQAEQSLIEKTGAEAEIVTTTSASSAEKMSGSTSLETGITADDTAISSMLATDKRATSSRDRDFVEEVREKIVENFRERMQLRRSLIELEDQNVQNSIEIGKMQLLLVEWHGGRHLPQEAASDALKGFAKHGEWAKVVAAAAEAARRDGEENADEETPAPSPEIRMAWRECEQLNSAILKNNETKRKISRRLKNNSRQAERFKADLDGKITGEDRNQLMKLQYRIGKLELDNMELEQNRIVHESAMREKDLTIQKLQLQLALRDRIAMLQQSVLQKHGIEACLECPGVVSGNSVNQGGITDALDALLLEEGFRISPESRGAEDDNGRADFEQIDVIDTNRGVDRPIARGRRGGWSSPPPQDKDDRSVKLVRAASDTNVAVMDSCDSDGRTDRGSVSNSPLKVPMKTSIVSSPITIVDKEDDGMHHLVGCMKQAFPGKTDDDGNGDEVERGRGRRTTGKSQRTGGMKGARTRSTQPLPPTLRSRPQETRPPQTHRVSTGAAGAAVDHQRLGNREKESLYEGLVISSIPCGYVERKCTRAAPGDVKGGSTLTQEVPPTSVEVAPFHGLVPASPLASSYSHVNNDTLGGRAPSIILNPAADGRTLCQEDGSLLDTVAVVGVSLKQQASNKGFHQRVIPTAGGNDRWRRSQGNALGAKEVTVTVPIRTWDEVDGRRDRCKEGARRDSDQDASDDVEDLAVMPSGTGEPIAAAVRDGGRDRRGKLVNRKSYAHKVSSFEVEAASSGQANKGGGGIFCMGARLTRGISGESVKYMPWGERREGSTALIAAVRSGPDRGATHQRIRREKIGKASEPSNRSKACNHAGDGGGD